MNQEGTVMKKFFTVSVLMAALGAVGAQAGEIHNRQVWQQERIANGVASGRLQPWETARLEREEGRLHREIAFDRATHCGRLTPREFRQINRQQNALSNQIYRYNHNERW
jgi:hypothetical protein